MAKKIAHTPGAFPLQAGMDLRDYFAAHAPGVPDWFIPIMAEYPEDEWLEVERKSLDSNAAIYIDDFRYAKVKRGFESEELTNRVSNYNSRCKTLRENVMVFGKERDRQYIIQWPYYWADIMLVEREKEVSNA